MKMKYMIPLVVVVILVAGFAGYVYIQPDTPLGNEKYENGYLQSTNEYDDDKHLTADNNLNQTVNLSLEVIRVSTNETVHQDTYILNPDTYVDVYNLSDDAGGEIEEYRFMSRLDDGQEHEVTIRTNKCYGDVVSEVQPDGELYMYYAIC